MALGISGSYAEAALTAILALLAAEHDDFDADIATANLEPILDEIETMVRAMFTDAEVAFASGDFSGTDSNGDTPDTIAAAGGTIS